MDLSKSTKALWACEKLRKVSLIRSKKKHIFTDYGKQVTYACVRPQVSRNSQNVLNYAPFLEKLPKHHWDSLVWLMQCAEMCCEMIADHQVISHLHHAKKVVPSKTMSDTSNGSCSSSKYNGGSVFGTNVFLHCQLFLMYSSKENPSIILMTMLWFTFVSNIGSGSLVTSR